MYSKPQAELVVGESILFKSPYPQTTLLTQANSQPKGQYFLFSLKVYTLRLTFDSGVSQPEGKCSYPLDLCLAESFVQSQGIDLEVNTLRLTFSSVIIQSQGNCSCILLGIYPLDYIYASAFCQSEGINLKVVTLRLRFASAIYESEGIDLLFSL